MWVPDILTIYLVIVLVNLLLTLLIFVFWKTWKTYDGFVLWALSLLIQAGTYLLFMLRGAVPDLVSILLANVLAVLAALVRVDGILRFIQSKPLPIPAYCVLFPFAVVFSLFIDAPIVARSLIITLVIPPVLIAGGLLMALVKEPGTRTLRFLFAASLVLPMISMILRQAWWMMVPGQYGILGTDLPNVAFFLLAILGDIIATSSFLLLNMVRSQRELAASEEQYRNLADNLPDYVVIHDGKTIRYANPAAARLAGTAAENLVGVSIYTFLTEESSRMIDQLIRQAMERTVPYPPREVPLKLPDGQVRQCLVKTVPFRDRDVLAFLSVITDVTEQRAAEEALLKVNKKLSILSSITRHDIKNQLLALRSYLALSAMSLDDGERMSGYIGKERAIAETIEHQIDFTKTYDDMGGTAPSWQNVDAAMRRAVAAFDRKRVAVAIDRTDLEVYADPMFEKVFFNLIDNAVRHGGREVITIRSSSHETGSGLVMVCEDDGVGIGIEDKPHLFEQGFGKHTGLGLFLSREILSITGITIAETGTPGRGARFEMAVPPGGYRYVHG